MMRVLLACMKRCVNSHTSANVPARGHPIASIRSRAAVEPSIETRMARVPTSWLKIDEIVNCEIDKSISDPCLEVAKTRFQTFVRGKGVLFTWKCQIQEFHAHGMERGEVLKRYCG